MLRKLRAALIISALWVLCWTPVALVLDHVLVALFVPEPRIDNPYTPVRVWAIWGALSGLAFAIVLGLAERGRAVGGLSAARVLTWGAVGSALVPVAYWVLTWRPPAPSFGPLFWQVTLITMGISALLGTVCAVLTVALMRAGTAQKANASASGAA
jgi:hypothetical protein